MEMLPILHSTAKEVVMEIFPNYANIHKARPPGGGAVGPRCSAAVAPPRCVCWRLDCSCGCSGRLRARGA